MFLFTIPTEAMLWVKEVEMVDTVDDLMSSSLYKRNFNARFLKHSMREIASALKQNHPEYPLQEKGQSGGTESPKRGPLFSEQDRSLA